MTQYQTIKQTRLNHSWTNKNFLIQHPSCYCFIYKCVFAYLIWKIILFFKYKWSSASFWLMTGILQHKSNNMRHTMYYDYYYQPKQIQDEPFLFPQWTFSVSVQFLSFFISWNYLLKLTLFSAFYIYVQLFALKSMKRTYSFP